MILIQMVMLCFAHAWVRRDFDWPVVLYFVKGRFGNQAEQFLGVISFTRTLNRTLVLPHWIEYPPRSAISVKKQKIFS